MRNIFRFPLACLFSLLLIQMPSYAFQKNDATHVITVSPDSSASANTTELRNAIAFLVNRPDKTTRWTLKLNPGKYVLSAQVTASKLQNATLTSADLKNPAKLVKMPGWNSATSAEYLLAFLMCKAVDLVGIEFYGQTDFAANTDPYWPDQGVELGSCDTVKVDQNKFFNFGNAALRVVTDHRDPVAGVDSFRTSVTNNIFNNIYQTATTATDLIHGGTAKSTWRGNNFYNLRGSVKFASRTPGATDIEFFNNTINGGDHFGLEINNYSNFAIKGNIFANIKSVAVNIYTAAGIKGFPWGDNFTISNNALTNVWRGIRFSHEASSDGFQYTPQNLVIENNVLNNVTDTTNYAPAIMVTNGKVLGVKITGNKMSNIASKKYISVTQGSTNVSILNNLVNGTILGPQSITAALK